MLVEGSRASPQCPSHTQIDLSDRIRAASAFTSFQGWVRSRDGILFFLISETFVLDLFLKL
jgi:hypothetical protein